MINSIKFENFRGLKQLELPELSQITLLTGRNNAGKSSILEGVFLFMDHTATESFNKINILRGLPVASTPRDLWEPAFYGLNTDNPLSILIKMDGEECRLSYDRDDSFIPVDNAGAVQGTFGQFIASTRSTYTLKFHFQQGDYAEDGAFSINETGYMRNIRTNLQNNQIRFLPATRVINAGMRDDIAVATWVGQMELKGEKQKVIEVLKKIEPNITDIVTISNQLQAQIYAKVMDQLIPIKLAGDGLNRMLYIVLAIMENPNSILLIDEIDAGFHYSALKDLWRVVAESAKGSGCQVIASTHSYECVQNAVSGIDAANMESNFCLYRVERKDGENRAFRYDGELAHSAVDANMEVR